MRSEVQRDLEFSDSHLDQIEEILRQCASEMLNVNQATIEQDLKKATDLIVTTQGAVAVRVRRPNVRHRYRELTIRAFRTSGTKTELEKIKEGYADFYLYCWTDTNDRIADWILVDLNHLRATDLLYLEGHEKWNRDHRTSFYWLEDWRLRNHGCIVMEKASIPEPVHYKQSKLFA